MAEVHEGDTKPVEEGVEPDVEKLQARLTASSSSSQQRQEASQPR